MATPQSLTAQATSGGSLAAGTYGYRVIARRVVGIATARVDRVGRGKGDDHGRRRRARPLAGGAGASEYRVYGRTPGAEATYWRSRALNTSTPVRPDRAEAVPTSAGTLWSVKNIFELKNARNVVVTDNIMENHWKESQPGFAIVLTPRNSNGACTWCGLDNVRFENNIVRNAAAGVNLLGYDSPSRPTRQSTNISISGNVFRLDTALGGNAWFMQIGDEPKTVAIKHNTVDANGNALVYTYGGTAADPREIYGLDMVANASRHGSYGMNGQNFSYGNGILNAYYPGYVFSKNYLAGALLSKYPAGTLSAGVFQDQFVNAAGGDYTVKAGSILKGAAPDATDIGADFTVLSAKTAGVVAGNMNDQTSSDTDQPIAPNADFTVACTFLNCTFTDTSIRGTLPISTRSWTFGDAATATGAGATHAFAAAGTYSITYSVADANGLSGTATKNVTVDAPLPPLANLQMACEYLQCSFADVSTAGSGAIVSRSWTFGDGTPAVTDATSGMHVYTVRGTYQVTLQVTDVNGLSATSSTQVTVEPPNVLPVPAFATSCVDLTCTFTDRSTDVDGQVAAWAWSFGTSSSTLQSPAFTLQRLAPIRLP